MSQSLPDSRGHFGPFGGMYVPETLMSPLEELTAAYVQTRDTPEFQAELNYHLRYYAGRPTPLYFCRRATEQCGGAKICLKREDLAHTGAHKINNVLGQILLARHMGKKRVIAETGAGQHGVATATAAAVMGLECEVYMGEEDMERQALNVFRMRLLGARVIPVSAGSRTLKDAISEAFRDWVTNVETTYYCLGSVVGPHPYPMMVREFQSVVGKEAREQILEAEGNLPTAVVACVGGGSNAMGIFWAFLNDDVRLIGVEAAGRGLSTGQHAASLTAGTLGVLHGAATKVLQTAEGQIRTTHSVSAGLDYPGVGPEHAYLQSVGRAEYLAATDEEALQAFLDFSRWEGIIPALEPAHALAHAKRLASTLSSNDVILVNLSGRGDKDVALVQGILEGSGA